MRPDIDAVQLFEVGGSILGHRFYEVVTPEVVGKGVPHCSGIRLLEAAFKLKRISSSTFKDSILDDQDRQVQRGSAHVNYQNRKLGSKGPKFLVSNHIGAKLKAYLLFILSKPYASAAAVGSLMIL